MSVQCNTYVIRGVRFDYKAFDKVGSYDDIVEPYRDNAFKPDFNPRDGITVLFDGMCGKYVIVGRVFHKTDNWRGFEGGEEVIDLSDPTYSMFDADIETVLARLFPALKPFTLSTLVVSHYR